jgi:hypothetical protein
MIHLAAAGDGTGGNGHVRLGARWVDEDTNNTVRRHTFPQESNMQ